MIISELALPCSLLFTRSQKFSLPKPITMNNISLKVPSKPLTQGLRIIRVGLKMPVIILLHVITDSNHHHMQGPNDQMVYEKLLRCKIVAYCLFADKELPLWIEDSYSALFESWIGANYRMYLFLHFLCRQCWKPNSVSFC